ncbi:asparagine synthase (glutamine-hydrolyzing) [Sulfurovum sp. XTW-4]|uniref:asparagine synthase (glutamine-hydrolyzing) n=1 Tax=Sulfurovum xiamenensis TaxID=3019066 RepID=A0ABT7QPB4_9BACT|nr:asparagine synthase (glutamine-hydrolyzing) [Sulfurovum xiamenensis]MDM5262627.1 asparagine synthase (glutamine-hydrolyzing) [Sulfurovum xiamenensis]
MCGIVGFVSKNRDEESIHRMLHIQNYRGPDDHGVYVQKIENDIVHLGHNRLSIQDLSSHGHQPFVSDCENYIIVFNGEVYNFKSIRIELEKLGYKFVSESDTEVILYAYKAWGMKAVEKFLGMFAFSILDKNKQTMFLVRDRAGVKPLYYYDNGGEFLFASELKSFHEHPSFQKEQNNEVLPYYFQFGYIPAPYSIFKNTYKLRPGHYLEYDLISNTYNVIAYWSADACYAKEKFDKSEKEILADLEELLTDAVDLRMVSDVPVGVFLSGGYDSSLVTALLSKDKSRKLHTFTIGFDDKKYNEAEHAKAIAKHFGTEHTEYYVSKKDMLDKVQSLPFYYDEPFGDSSAIPTMMVSELAKKDVTVALSADGGDEAFCGYSKYFFLNKFAPVFSNSFQKTMLKSMLNVFDGKQIEQINSFLPKKIQQTNIRDKYNKFKRAMNADSLEMMFRNASSYVDSQVVKSFLKLEANSSLYENFSMKKDLSFLDNMMLTDYKTFMVDDVLTKVDRATMSVSLEGREPLLDHRIIEFMAKVPVELKYKNNQGKYLARKILYKHIPQALIDKPKAGFQIPLAEWLQTDLKPLVEKYLDPFKLDKEIFNVEEVEILKKDLFNGNLSNVNAIWFILMYEMWKEKWFT